MNLKNLEDSLNEISKELEDIQGRREKILKESRDVITLSARAIVKIHTGKPEESKDLIKSASDLLVELQKIASGELYRYLIQPEAEYVEASTLYAVVSTGRIPRWKKLKVRGAAYLLGLLDVVGEIKRMVYDTIRKGRDEEALSLFTLMERIYTQVSPYAIYDHVAPGLRRKLDVARLLIEDTRSAITEESRRMELMKAVEELSKKLPSVSPGKEL